jgi:hypothetical protein
MRTLVLLTVLFMLIACRNAAMPEAQVRATIAQAEFAAEHKEIATLRGMVSDNYADAEGHDKRAVEGVLRYYFLRNQSIHLVTRVASVTLPQKDRALAVVYVGMAAQPVADVGELERLRADLFRFELEFAKEGDDWRVLRAQWRRAELTDFVQ